ncbi:MAG: LptF/LptG family permease [Bacteroidales bacterium]
MKRLNRFILKAYIGPLCATFLIVLFVIIMQFLWKYIDDLVGKGLEWYIILQLIAYAGASFVPLALPLAILLASLMTFGNLGEHYELVAMKAAGISLKRIMAPLIRLTLLFSIGMFFFSNNLLPYINLKFKSLLYDVRQQKLALDLKEGIFDNSITGFAIRVGKKSKNDKTLYNVHIYDHSNGQGNTRETIAKKGNLSTSKDKRFLYFTLFDGHNYEDLVNSKNYRQNRPFLLVSFKKQVIRKDISEFSLSRTKEDLFKNHYDMLNLSQLRQAIDSLDQELDEKEVHFQQNITERFSYLPATDTLEDTKKDSISKVLNDSIVIAENGILGNFNKEEQKSILSLAINNNNSTIRSIEFNINDFQSRQERINNHWISWHQTFTYAFACIIFFFIGAPLGAIIRKGGLGMPVVISVAFFVIYFVIVTIGKNAVMVGELDIIVGMWMASAILLPVGIFLTRKATSDSPLMDNDIWKRFFKKLIQRKN